MSRVYALFLLPAGLNFRIAHTVVSAFAALSCDLSLSLLSTPSAVGLDEDGSPPILRDREAPLDQAEKTDRQDRYCRLEKRLICGGPGSRGWYGIVKRQEEYASFKKKKRIAKTFFKP